MNKSSFQVRHVTFEDILGTEENGMRRSYESKVSSSSSIQTALKASVTAMQPVTLGVDSELSRGKEQNRKTKGVKVLNRTVSFKEDFKEKRMSIAEMGGPGSESTFEERLSHWILHGTNATQRNSCARNRWQCNPDSHHYDQRQQW